MALLVESAMNLLTIGPHADAWKLVAESLVFVPVRLLFPPLLSQTLLFFPQTEAIDVALSPLTSVATLDIIKVCAHPKWSRSSNWKLFPSLWSPFSSLFLSVWSPDSSR